MLKSKLRGSVSFAIVSVGSDKDLIGRKQNLSEPPAGAGGPKYWAWLLAAAGGYGRLRFAARFRGPLRQRIGFKAHCASAGSHRLLLNTMRSDIDRQHVPYPNSLASLRQ